MGEERESQSRENKIVHELTEHRADVRAGDEGKLTVGIFDETPSNQDIYDCVHDARNNIGDC